MKTGRRSMHRPTRERRGSMLLLIAVSLIFVLAGVVFSVDVAYMHLARTELKAVTDLSASAAVEALTRTQSESAAVAAAVRLAGMHQVAGRTLSLQNQDVELGRHVYNGTNRITFSPGLQPYTAARIDGKLTSDSQSGSLSTFFGGVFGLNHFDLERASVAAQMDRDIVLVLDVSTSMSNDTRFDDMISATRVFLDEIDLTHGTEHVSIVTYSRHAQTVQQLTSDTALLRAALNTVAIAEPNTAIGEGLQQGINSLTYDPFSRPLAQQQIIVLTDGNHNTGISPMEVVPSAVALHYTVNTITFSSDANQTFMIDLATYGGGIHLHANDDEQLIDAFREMARGVKLQLID